MLIVIPPIAVAVLAVSFCLSEEPERKLPDLRLVPPASAEQSAAEKWIREVYKSRYAQREAPAIVSLASDLLREGLESKVEPATRFVLFREARDLALKAGELAIAMNAIDAMDARFSIKAIDMKADALAAAARSAKTPPAFVAVCDGALSLIPRAISEENYPTASLLARTAGSAAQKAKSKYLIAFVRSSEKEVRYLQKEWEQSKAASEQLLLDPQLPEANTAVGRYLCLTNADLNRSVNYLARCTLAILKAAAEKEVAGPKDPLEQVFLGDRWLEAAQDARNLCKEEGVIGYRLYFIAEDFRRRAIKWYETALPALDVAKKELIARQLEKISGRTRTRPVGGGGGGPYEDLPADKGILVGLRLCVGSWAGHAIIRGLQPIFWTPQGRVLGAVHGSLPAEFKEVLARPGYAVGGISAKGGLRLDGFRITFLRVDGGRLDLQDSYESEWLGGRGGSDEIVLGSNGSVVLGIHGNSGAEIDSLGLVMGP